MSKEARHGHPSLPPSLLPSLPSYQLPILTQPHVEVLLRARERMREGSFTNQGKRAPISEEDARAETDLKVERREGGRKG